MILILNVYSLLCCCRSSSSAATTAFAAATAGSTNPSDHPKGSRQYLTPGKIEYKKPTNKNNLET